MSPATSITVDTLREAARLMRERADLPYVKGVWEARGVYICKASNSPRIGYPAHAEAACVLHDEDDARVTSEAIAEHIAAWNPAVALAVADWLDQHAEQHNPSAGRNECTWTDDGCAALAVARAFLGATP